MIILYKMGNVMIEITHEKIHINNFVSTKSLFAILYQQIDSSIL